MSIFRKLSFLAIFMFLAFNAAAKELPPSASSVEVSSSISHPVLVSGKSQTAYIKVSLTSNKRTRYKLKHIPINVAIVIDKSGSMSGNKIAQARKAAITAVQQLSREDIVSVIVYSDGAEVLVPATKVADRESIIAKIEQISANGSTALHAGVVKGAGEVRKFLRKNQVNRVVLLSDGLANVGPQSTEALELLGRELGGSRISVTTLGLGGGYNEDLMSRLAAASDGNHAFVESADDLVSFFNKEFGSGMMICARDAVITIKCARGIEPVRLLGRQGKIDGNTVTVKINQIYEDSERYALLEVKTPTGINDDIVNIAETTVTYTDLFTERDNMVKNAISARYSSDKALAEKNVDNNVYAAAIRQIATENSRKAVALRDKGDIEGAKVIIGGTISILREKSQQMPAMFGRPLSKLAESNEADLKGMETKEGYDTQRKVMRARQTKDELQNVY